MSDTIEIIFEPLKQALMARSYSAADVFHIIGGFAETSPPVAQAMAFHCRDIVAAAEAEGTEYTYKEVLVEMYRRTFFALEHAEKYGTANLIEQGEDMLRSFADYLITSLDMDDAQDVAQGFAHLPVPGRCQ